MRNGFRVWLMVVFGMWVVASLSQRSLGQGGAGCGISVALYGAEGTPGRLSNIASKLLADERIESVETFNLETMTPSVAGLLEYDAVMVWTNGAVKNANELGDNLAEYVDLGGGVVVAMFTMAAPDPTKSIGGRFLTENYYCILRVPGSIVSGRATLGTLYDPEHQILQGVATFDGGPNSFRTSAPLHTSTVRVADWSTGEALVAERTDLLGGRVDLGFWPTPSDSASNGWLVSTDGAQLMSNALVAVSECGQGAGLNFCESPIAATAPPDPDLGCVALHVSVGGEVSERILIPFTTAGGGAISNMTLWGVYAKGSVPAEQSFELQIWSRSDSGRPLSLLHSAVATTVPVDTGFKQTAGGSPRTLHEFQLELDPPFIAGSNQKLAMIVSPFVSSGSLCWQLSSAFGTHLVVRADGSPATMPGSLAYAICRPGGAIGCYDFGGSLRSFSGTDRFRGHAYSFPLDERLTEIRFELDISTATDLHWSVLASESREGDYTLVHTNQTSVAANGRRWYSSGPIDIALERDLFYLIGLTWGGETVTYFTDRAAIPRGWALGTMEFACGVNNASIPVPNSIAFGEMILSPFDEYAISLCFGGESRCVCDLFDTSSGVGVCDIFDTLAFQAALLAGDPAACDLDLSTGPGVCDVFDFLAFQTAFLAGCP